MLTPEDAAASDAPAANEAFGEYAAATAAAAAAAAAAVATRQRQGGANPNLNPH